MAQGVGKPDWLALSKYDQLENISSYEWAYLLSVRHFWNNYFETKNLPTRNNEKIDRYLSFQTFLYRNGYLEEEDGKIFDPEHNPVTFKGQKNLDAKMLLAFNDHLEDPLKVILVEDVEKFDAAKYFDDGLNKNSDLFGQCVSPLMVGELLDLSSNLPSRFHIGYDEASIWRSLREKWKIDSVKLVEQTATRDMTHRGYKDKSGICYLSINLMASDVALFRDFKKYIKQARKKYDYLEGESVRPSIISQLFHKKILPYIDLSQWLKVSNRSIPQHKIGEWLFEDNIEVDATEKLRRQTIPLAERALSREFIETIYSYD